MPGTAGLWGARSSSQSRDQPVWLPPDVLEFDSNGLTLARDVLARAGLDQDEDLVIELAGDGYGGKL